MIYLDWNATTPPLPEVTLAMTEAAAHAWANPSSVHAAGRRARSLVEGAREAVAALTQADPRDVVFTSGGTEANNLALRSLFPGASTGAGAVLVTSRLEHPSIVRVAEALEAEGRARVRWLRILEDGRLDPDDARAAIAEPEVRLIAVQAVNHETGVLQPVAEIIDAARAARGAPRVHVDAVQAFGKLAPEELAATLRADSIAVAAHKFRGPKGIGALVVRPGLRVLPVLLGGAQERGFRPGTVDPVGAAGFAVAARVARTSGAPYAAIAALRDRLESALLAEGARRVGSAPRAAHVTNLAFPGWAGPELVAALDLEGVCISSGSACSAGTSEPSPVVSAMLGPVVARSAARFSLGLGTSDDDVRRAIERITRVLRAATNP